MASLTSLIKAMMDWMIKKLTSITTNSRFIKLLSFILITGVLRKIYKSYEAKKMKASAFQPRILIIGAGMSGITAAVKIKTKLNLNNFIIYERNADVGGTWYDNSYPGCKCDVPGLNYSLSHDQPKHWIPNYFPTGAETLQYEKDVCKKHKLYPHIEFNCTVTQMIYDKDKKIWTVTITNNKTNKKQNVCANIVISGVGILSQKSTPNFKNADKFKGNSFHSSEWDHNYDLTNKNVAVIGTGPTAIQVVPSVARTNINKLYVFQRSISHVIPKLEATNRSKKFWQIIFRCLPFMQPLSRCYQYFWAELLFYPGLKKGSKMADAFALVTETYRKRCFANNLEMFEKTKPSTVYGKRVCLSSEYFQAYNQDNVEVITDTIDEFTENGIRLKNGEEINLDCIAYCTGFKTQEFLSSIADGVIGKNGKNLQCDTWQTNNCFAYLGIIVSGYPNLFILYGPGTNLVHNSVLFMIECAMDYTCKCIKKMMLNGYTEIDVKQEEMNKFVKRLDKENTRNAWMINPNQKNWYKNDKGRGSTNWAWSCNYYWWSTKCVKWSKFNLQ